MSHGETLKLLVVDDDPGICELVADVATGMGFETRTRQTPDELWADLDAFDPDVLMLDLDLPHIDGVRLLGMLGEKRARQDILLISGLDNRTLATARRIGRSHGLTMAGTLQKPFPLSDLEAALAGFREHETPPDRNELAAAIERRELVVHYQPKVADDRRGDGWRLHSAEALIRWRHPRLGLIYPDSFVPMAEAASEVLAMTRYVIADAVDRLAEWRDSGIDSAVSVNISPLLLARTELPDEIDAMVEAGGVEPERLILEITETAAMQDPARSTEVLTRLRVKGFGLALDDFGTGYSSLVQLYRMPFSELKVDKSFVFELGENPESEVIVRAIIGLGHSLGLEVCAEGVETAAAMGRLADLGCDLFQGYHVARPGPPEAIAAAFGPKKQRN